VLSLPSGYQRDLQLTKAPVIRGLEVAVQALSIVPALVNGLSFNEQRMRDAITKDMFATDLAQEEAARGVPFREAYQAVKRQLAELPQGDVEQSLASRVSPGACGALNLEEIRTRLESLIEKISSNGCASK